MQLQDKAHHATVIGTAITALCALVGIGSLFLNWKMLQLMDNRSGSPSPAGTPSMAPTHIPIFLWVFGTCTLLSLGVNFLAWRLQKKANSKVSKLITRRSVYDVVSDCSIVDGPPEPWKYGYSLGVGNGFNPFEARQPSAFAEVDRWFCIERHEALGIMHNRTNHTVIGSPATYTIPAGMMHMHPGIDGYCAVIRWRCPEDGIYTIQGSCEGLDRQLGADPEVHIMKNSGDLWHRTLGGVPSVETFSLTNSFESNDTLDFVVSQGAQWGADSVGLKATIRKV